MPNIQQPEMRRSGKDPLVQDSAVHNVDAQGGGPGGGKPEKSGPVPPDQRPGYGPEAPQETAD